MAEFGRNSSEFGGIRRFRASFSQFFREILRSKINFFKFPFNSALKYGYGDASELQIRTDPRIRNFSALKRIQKIEFSFGRNSAENLAEKIVRSFVCSFVRSSVRRKILAENSNYLLLCTTIRANLNFLRMLFRRKISAEFSENFGGKIELFAGIRPLENK